MPAKESSKPQLIDNYRYKKNFHLESQDTKCFLKNEVYIFCRKMKAIFSKNRMMWSDTKQNYFMF